MIGKEHSLEYSTTKDRIIRSALRLFSKKGFRGTTMKDIAGEVGITEGAIYRHFVSKEEIIGSIVEAIYADISSMIDNSVSLDDSAEEIIGAIIEVLFNYFYNNRESFRFLLVYYLLREDSDHGRMPGEVVLEILKTKSVRDRIAVSPEVAMSIIVGSIDRIFMLEELGFLKKDYYDILKELKFAVLRAIL